MVNLLLLSALGLLAVGVTAPILTLEKFYIFANTVSVWSALRQLIAEGEWGLFALVGVFSVVFPMAKIITLLVIWNLEAVGSPAHQRHLRWLTTYGKWSMLDVFVVALLVVSVKLGSLATATVEYGIYVFAASVLLTMGLSAWIGRQAKP
jgi:paraquat-inducible protein A